MLNKFSNKNSLQNHFSVSNQSDDPTSQEDSIIQSGSKLVQVRRHEDSAKRKTKII